MSHDTEVSRQGGSAHRLLDGGGGVRPDRLLTGPASPAAFDRRQLLRLLAAAAAWVSAAEPLTAARTGAGAGAPAPPSLADLFEAFLRESLDASPEQATSLGLDTGARSWARSALDDRSLASRAKEKRRIASQLQQVRDFDSAPLRGAERTDFDVVRWILDAADRANRRYEYGRVGAGAPYVISQLTGAYGAIPEFLDGQHRIGSRDDVDAYLSRVAAFAVALDQEIEVVRHDSARGCWPPDFVLAGTLAQLKRLRDVSPRDAGLVTSVAQRAKEKGIPGDPAGEAEVLVSERVYPALDRQIALLTELRAGASRHAGVWRLPDGDEYYVDSLTAWTSTPLSPLEVHRLGLDAVEEYSARIDEILRRQGRTGGTVGERVRALFTDPELRYPDSEAGRQTLLADAGARIEAVHARLSQHFGVLPRANVVVKRVPQYMEAAWPRGYYQPPSIDGTRPGAVYLNLRDMSEIPRWTLPTRVYHQGIPGHHVKHSVYQEANLPALRKLLFYAAYLEGWSLYAEQLADEMGMYEEDLWGRFGFLVEMLRAAVGLVTDTGIHVRRWSREKAVRYMVETLGDPESAAITEVERYCVWPAQVCSYLLDHLAILRLREETKRALGPRFDIRRFHDAILLCGPAPQEVLATVVGGDAVTPPPSEVVRIPQ